MHDLALLTRDFIYRDLAFILGGGIVLGSMAYAFGWLPDRLDFKEIQTAYAILFAALAYVVGYAVQDVLAIPRITFTGHPFIPFSFMKFIYHCFTGSSWTNVSYLTNETSSQFEIRIDRLDIPEATLRNLDRILSLKVISMCVGGCSLLGSVILSAKVMLGQSISGKAVLALIALFAFSISLIVLGWIKGMQQMQFYQAIHEAGYPPTAAPPAPRPPSATAVAARSRP